MGFPLWSVIGGGGGNGARGNGGTGKGNGGRGGGGSGVAGGSAEALRGMSKQINVSQRMIVRL